MRLPNKGLMCVEQGCQAPAHTKQLCKKHYSKDLYRRRYGAMVLEIAKPIDISTLPVEEVGRLRSKGVSYSAIAGQLGMSKREVQEVCRAMDWVVT